ncbi:MAG: hypothetical protein CM15mP8_0430 [Methanobacteriota archaeon]|nr:MAG: hypothetical protein CM15mP8_0430 [Euryarchaeota archaeon]
MVYIATNMAELAVGSLRTNDWINLTTTDGLPTNLIEDLIVDSTNLSGLQRLSLAKMDIANNAVNVLTSANGSC